LFFFSSVQLKRGSDKSGFGGHLASSQAKPRHPPKLLDYLIAEKTQSYIATKSKLNFTVLRQKKDCVFQGLKRWHGELGERKHWEKLEEN